MSKQTEALKLALEVIRNQGDVSVDEWIATEKAIKEALAQPEQEPVATFDEVWDSIDWNKWRMEPIKELVKMIHSKTSPKPLTTHPAAWHIPNTDSFISNEMKNHIGVRGDLHTEPLYTHPPVPTAQRKPLTRGQIREIEVDVSLNPSFDYITPAEQLCRAIEAAHGIKENT